MRRKQTGDFFNGVVMLGSGESKTVYFSPKELRVIRLLADGKSTKDIAPVLCYGTKTIDNYRSELLKKLEARNVANLVAICLRQKIIE